MAKNILTKGFHKHHILPKFLGGTDDPENLVLLHPIDHAIAHLVRFKIYKQPGDLLAVRLINSHLDPETGFSSSLNLGESHPSKRPEVSKKFTGRKKGTKWTEEQKQIRSKEFSGENNPMFGKRWSWSNEQKNNIKNRKPANIKPIITPFGEFESIKKASEEIGISTPTIISYCKNNKNGYAYKDKK